MYNPTGFSKQSSSIAVCNNLFVYGKPKKVVWSWKPKKGKPASALSRVKQTLANEVRELEAELTRLLDLAEEKGLTLEG